VRHQVCDTATVVDLGDLLATERLALVPVVDTSRDDPLRWVAASELADPAPFLEGGEVLLTTGLETVHWTRRWDAYVRRLANVGVVAVGLAVGLTYTDSPAALVRACRRHRVDLFEVPASTTFVAISHAVAGLLQREEESATRAALAAQQALTQAALREEEPLALLETVARVGAAAAVTDARGAFLLGPRGERPDLLKAVLDSGLVAEAVGRMRPQGLRAAASLSEAGTSVLVHPLGVRGRPSRYLVTAFTGRASQPQRSSIATAVALLSLAEERRRVGREADRRLRSRAVEFLAAGDLRTATVLLGAGSGPRPRLPRTAVVLRCRGGRSRLEDGLETVEAVPALAGVVTAGNRDELVAVVRRAEARPLAETLAGAGLRVGIGAAGAVQSLATSHESAGHALDLTTTGAPLVSWDDGVRRGVLGVLDQDRAAAFGASYLAPIVELGDDSLLDTLAEFLRQHGSLLKVAEELGVHRNTVRNRIERIESLLNRSLLDPQVRVDAWVALQSRAVAVSPSARSVRLGALPGRGPVRVG
jgi:purine catabolism regulator